MNKKNTKFVIDDYIVERENSRSRFERKKKYKKDSYKKDRKFSNNW